MKDIGVQDERERVSAGLQSIVGQATLDAAFAKLDQVKLNSISAGIPFHFQ